MEEEEFISNTLQRQYASQSPLENYPLIKRAEAAVLERSATNIKENLHRTQKRVVIFSDALSELQALKDPQNKNLNDLSSALASLAE